MTTKEEAHKLGAEANEWYNYLVDHLNHGGYKANKILKRADKNWNAGFKAWETGEYDKIIQLHSEMKTLVEECDSLIN